MARRAEQDTNDDFEIVTPTSSIKRQQSFEFLEKDTQSSLTNTNPIQLTPINEKPGSVPIKTDIPIARQSLDNSSLSTNANCLPIRYGSAAMIPHDDGFDLQAVLNSKPRRSIQTDDLMHDLQSVLTNKPRPSLQTDNLMQVLQNEKPKKGPTKDNSLNQLLIDNNRDRKSLVQIAKQASQDFLDAIYLD